MLCIIGLVVSVTALARRSTSTRVALPPRFSIVNVNDARSPFRLVITGTSSPAMIRNASSTSRQVMLTKCTVIGVAACEPAA